jgi:5-methylthioadenosine/S-adenosylhomocysteine deaminase
MNTTTCLHARWVIPVEPATQVLSNQAVVVRDGVIVDMLDTTAARSKYTSAEHVGLGNHALLPGLVNAHTHAAMTLFRGLADDLPLMDWLQNHIWPAEARWVDPEFVRDGSELAMAEMIRGGTTCFNDMYFFPEETAHVALQANVRACVGQILIDFPSRYAQTPEEYLHKGLKLHDELQSQDLVTTAFAPHAPYTVSDGPLTRLVTLANELDLPVHMHVHETKHEVDDALTRTGMRPLERLANAGLLNPRFIAVHMTQLLGGEIESLGKVGANVVHCPESNLKLASGFCPVQALAIAGVNVALGTDGAASNNDLDMLGELRTAALLAKAVSGNATALPAHAALEMATINGAKALGLDDKIGSIKTGKAADLVAIDLSSLSCQPVYDPISQIVYTATREQVTDVWVAGKRLLNNRKLTTLDEGRVLHKAHAWRDKIKS